MTTRRLAAFERYALHGLSGLLELTAKCSFAVSLALRNNCHAAQMLFGDIETIESETIRSLDGTGADPEFIGDFVGGLFRDAAEDEDEPAKDVKTAANVVRVVDQQSEFFNGERLRLLGDRCFLFVPRG